MTLTVDEVREIAKRAHESPDPGIGAPDHPDMTALHDAAFDMARMIQAQAEIIENQRAARSALISVASEIVRRKNIPNEDEWPWPKRGSKMLRRVASSDLDRAADQCGRWALSIKAIADTLAETGASRPRALSSPRPRSD